MTHVHTATGKLESSIDPYLQSYRQHRPIQISTYQWIGILARPFAMQRIHQGDSSSQMTAAVRRLS